MVEIDNFIIEASRKCNLQCAHCLRGAARRDNLDTDKLCEFLYQVSYIDLLTIGGGEPALALDVLDKIYDTIRLSDTVVGNIYVVTSGTYKTMELFEWWLHMMEICDDNELSKFTFSYDKWHTWALNGYQEKRRDSNFLKIEEALMLRGIEDKLVKHSQEEWSDIRLIKMGRAKDFGHREVTPNFIDVEEGRVTEVDMYFAANGEIYSSCDLSYVEMKPKSKFYIGRWDEDLGESIERYNDKLYKEFKTNNS